METNKMEKEVLLFTIGFAGKSAKKFFDILRENGVKKIIDIRLNNRSQLAGFTKEGDFEFFLEAIGGIKYEHILELAPDKSLLDDYQKKRINWEEYEKRFNSLLKERQIEKIVKLDELDRACLLCSEPAAEKCHRRLVAEYLQSIWPNIIIKHL